MSSKGLRVFTITIIVLAVLSSSFAVGAKTYLSHVGTAFENIDILDSHPLKSISEDGTYSDGFKDILVCGVDKRPYSTAAGFKDSRSDLMLLLSIDENTKVLRYFTLARDTRIKDKSGDYPKINEVLSYSGDPQQLVDAIYDNYGFSVDEVVIITWDDFISLCDAFLPEGVQTDLNGTELAGLNYVINTMNADFMNSPFENCIPDPYGTDTTGYYGFDALSFMKVEKNLIHGTVDGEKDSTPVDAVGRHLNIYEKHSTYLSDHLFNANTVLTAVGYPSFFEGRQTFTLNSYQILAYTRLRTPYPEQDSHRQQNLISLFASSAPKLIPVLTSASEREKAAKILQSKGVHIYTSYTSVNEIMSDVSAIRGFQQGEVVNGIVRTSLPYLNSNYKEQFAKLYDIN